MPKPVLPCQAVSGPQDAVLRRRLVPVLRAVRGGRARVPHRGVLQQGEVLGGGVQPGVHSDPPGVPAQGLRQDAHLVLVRAEQEGGQGGHPRASALRPRSRVLPRLLDEGVTRHPQG